MSITFEPHLVLGCAGSRGHMVLLKRVLRHHEFWFKQLHWFDILIYPEEILRIVFRLNGANRS